MISVLKNFAKFIRKHLCQSLFEEQLLQVFSCVTQLFRKTLHQGCFAKNVCETFQNSFRTEHPCGNASVSFSVSFVQPFKCRRVLKKFCSETLQGIHKNAPMTKSFCSKRIHHWCLLLNSVKCFEIILQNN